MRSLFTQDGKLTNDAHIFFDYLSRVCGVKDHGMIRTPDGYPSPIEHVARDARRSVFEAINAAMSEDIQALLNRLEELE